jgi:ABC-type dipeptide/oligopeptide/nickel transport system permease component
VTASDANRKVKIWHFLEDQPALQLAAGFVAGLVAAAASWWLCIWLIASPEELAAYRATNTLSSGTGMPAFMVAMFSGAVFGLTGATLTHLWIKLRAEWWAEEAKRIAKLDALVDEEMSKL